MAANVSWGIEVGAGALKAVKLEREGDGVRVLEFAIIPHKRPLSSPDIDEKEAKRVALGTLVSQYDLGGATIAVSIAGNTGFARFAKLPPVEPKKIPDIVKFEAVQQIPFPIEQVQWDYQTFASPGEPDVEVGIFAITTEKVMEKLAKWQDVERTPDLLTLSPLAAYNAIAFDRQFTEKTPGTIILDVGTTSTDLIVAEGGRLWIRTFSRGGHQFTEALVTGFNLPYAKADRLKREAETSAHSRQILQAMRPVFGELSQDVQRSIGYYQSLHREGKLTGVIGLGATFNIPGLRKFISQQIGMEVQRLEGFSRVRHADEAKNTEFQARSMELATAVGLALQGVGLGTLNANLMPLEVVRENMWSGKTAWFAMATGLALAAGGATFISPLRDAGGFSAASKAPVITETVARANALKNEWNEAQEKAKPDPRALAALTLLDGRDVYPALVNDLGLMMASAKIKAEAFKSKDARPLELQLGRYSTDFLVGAAPSEATGAPGGRGAPPPPEGGGEPHPRVHVRLEVLVNQPPEAADRFMTETFGGWLAANAQREGLAYHIDTEKSRPKVAPVRGPAGSGPGPGGRPGPEGGRGRVPTDDPRGSGPEPAGRAGGAVEIDKIAPLPSEAPAWWTPASGAVCTTYIVEYDALLGPATKKEANP